MSGDSVQNGCLRCLIPASPSGRPDDSTVRNWTPNRGRLGRQRKPGQAASGRLLRFPWLSHPGLFHETVPPLDGTGKGQGLFRIVLIHPFSGPSRPNEDPFEPKDGLVPVGPPRGSRAPGRVSRNDSASVFAVCRKGSYRGCSKNTSIRKRAFQFAFGSKASAKLTG